MGEVPGDATRWTARVERWSADNAAGLLAVVSAVAFGGSGIVGDQRVMMHLGRPRAWHYALLRWNWILLLVGGAFLLTSSVVAARKIRHLDATRDQLHTARAEVRDLQHAISEQQFAVKSILERVCEAVFAEMRCNNSDRVSLYIHDGKDAFIRHARYAQNPTLRGSGRVKYPDNEGVVGRAWANGSDTLFLAPADCTGNNWAKAMRDKGGLRTKTKAQDMRMKSASLMAHRLWDAAGHRPCGVLVFESELFRNDLDARPGFSGDAVSSFDRIMSSQLAEALAQTAAIVTTMAPIADPDVASREGF
jgi:hypothetical protein